MTHTSCFKYRLLFAHFSQGSNPLNVHRWRKLQDSDPERHEQIIRIHELQKILIQKTELVMEKDLIIQDKERLYVELKNILAR